MTASTSLQHLPLWGRLLQAKEEDEELKCLSQATASSHSRGRPIFFFGEARIRPHEELAKRLQGAKKELPKGPPLQQQQRKLATKEIFKSERVKYGELFTSSLIRLDQLTCVTPASNFSLSPFSFQANIILHSFFGGESLD